MQSQFLQGFKIDYLCCFMHINILPKQCVCTSQSRLMPIEKGVDSIEYKFQKVTICMPETEQWSSSKARSALNHPAISPALGSFNSFF